MSKTKNLQSKEVKTKKIGKVMTPPSNHDEAPLISHDKIHRLCSYADLLGWNHTITDGYSILIERNYLYHGSVRVITDIYGHLIRVDCISIEPHNYASFQFLKDRGWEFARLLIEHINGGNL